MTQANCAARIRGLLMLAVWVAGLVATTVKPVSADVTAAHRRELSNVKIAVRRAATFLRIGKLSEAAESAKEAQQKLGRLLKGASPDLVRQARKTHSDLKQVVETLTIRGIDLPALKDLAAMAESGPDDSGSVRFSRDVAPILISKCGRCHIDRQSGGLDLGTFAALSKGNDDGPIVLAGDADGSRLVEVIETGAMPKGGLKVSSNELAVLKKWIAVGARFDAEDPAERLTSLAPGARPEALPSVPVVTATGKETVSFAGDIAPILASRCAGCHGNGQQVRGRFNVTTFRGLLRGGDNGAPVVPGQAAESLLIAKLLGTAGGERMPAGRPPLEEASMVSLRTWIDEGAHFDGGDATRNIAEIAAIAKSRRQTHQELAEDRVKLGLQNWKLVMPNGEPERMEADQFLILGNLSPDRLESVRAAAEALVPGLKKTLGVEENQPFVKGRMTLFFFSSRYDYGEFGRMVEKRDLPSSIVSHGRFTQVDAYAAFFLPATQEESLKGLLFAPLAEVFLQSRGDLPGWFARGAAGALADLQDVSAARRLEQRRQLVTVLSRIKGPDDFTKGRLTAADMEIAGRSFCALCVSDRGRFRTLMRRIESGSPFPAAMEQAYGAELDKLVAIWLTRAARDAARRGRRGRS